ncbi:rhodanese-like domain-containing protein [Robiginitalea sp. M366]|uniref:rhodanese-like domain-containing protein n=1 Tax=Robiginitalea aestuariiviva TaxID=3036903 RepID=UPI00240E945F|nr:rhodanese-like domain-containing protein [Robiginitalea aestuariiviva]MDG1571556.1 rhodanese-like domain-containing protein [Robiginitalea aestuariiviva]
MKLRSSLSVLLLGVSSLWGTASAQEVGNKAYGVLLKGLLSRNVPEVDVAGARKLEDAVFLDARTREEYEVSHLHSARWVGYETFTLSRLEGLPKTTPLVVYCSVGYRSEKITRRLQREGYTRVFNLYGGIFEWVNQGQPVRDEQGETQRVHAYNTLWGVWLETGEKVY